MNEERAHEGQGTRKDPPVERRVFGMMRSSRKDPARYAALDRVRDWTRERFKLADDAAIMVTEITCTVPGCPPLETVVAFWTAVDRRHHFKVFKPLGDVVLDDLPPSWMKDALAGEEVFGCPCC